MAIRFAPLPHVHPDFLIDAESFFLLEGGQVAHHHVRAGPAKVFLESLGMTELAGSLDSVCVTEEGHVIHGLGGDDLIRERGGNRCPKWCPPRPLR